MSNQSAGPLPDAFVLASLPPVLYAYGFSLRKRRIVRRFVGQRTVRFVASAKHVPAHASLLMWGSRPAPEGMADNVAIVRMEDGFLRSVGLGADLIEPVSWVVDTRGIYYDTTRESDLEYVLRTAVFTPALRRRATALRDRIVASRITKYNVGCGTWRRPANSDRVILVPGQVESDASLKFGAPGIRTNMGLLAAVRQANPDAYIIYKPHPDVAAGLRKKGIDEEQAAQWCDEIITNIGMADLLPVVDEVHLLTSLAGFEALLRGKKVTCYGRPFYSGWGLTTDMMASEKRGRHLHLDELVAGTLLIYPVYASRITGQIITVEEAVTELLAWREAKPGWAKVYWHRILRTLLSIKG